MEHTTYLFIDGAYLHKVYRQAMRSVFGADGELKFETIARQTEAAKVFMYECLDEIRGESETEEQFRERGAAQEEYFARIRSLRGFHL